MTNPKPQLPSYYYVLDVESIGLDGAAFAYGVAVLDTKTGEIVHTEFASCAPYAARHSGNARHAERRVNETWVREHVYPALPHPTHWDFHELASHFLCSWNAWAARGATMAADVPYPVETGFLLDVAIRFNYLTPIYPLIDIASVRLAKGFDPMGITERHPDELPRHHPVRDAKHSARLLWEALTVK